MNKIKLLFVSFLCLICVREVMAQTDSVHYYMKIDTMQSGIRVGQDVSLRYICNVQYDSFTLPSFNAPVEVVKEAFPNRSGNAVVNGELTEIYEFGFEYIIKFQKEGIHNLPISKVEVNGKVYQTAPLSVWVQPAMPNVDGVECSISLEPKFPKLGEPLEVTLVCNMKPDSNRPTVKINGQKMESGGWHYSSINAEEIYKFIYRAQIAQGGDYIVSVEDLCFGGTPYDLAVTEFEVIGGESHGSKSGNSVSPWIWLVIAAAYMSIVYLLLWLQFRKEADEELVPFVLKHHRINLNTEWAYTHYGFPLTLLMIPLLFLGISVYAYVSGDNNLFSSLSWFVIILLVLAYFSYRNQRNKLNFYPITTTLSVEQIQQAIEKVAERNDWIIDHIDDRCFAAHTRRSFPQLSWGEQIFVVFDTGTVWVNSINDLNKKSVAFSFGYTKKNIRLLREAIER